MGKIYAASVFSGKSGCVLADAEKAPLEQMDIRLDRVLAWELPEELMERWISRLGDDRLLLRTLARNRGRSRHRRKQIREFYR